MERKMESGKVVPRYMWQPPTPAQPSDEVAVFVSSEEPRGLLEQRQRSNITECPNCHVQHPARVPVRCECGRLLMEATCHVCGCSLKPGETIPDICDRCGGAVRHTVKRGYSAERMAGMFGGLVAAYSFVFHPDAYVKFQKLPRKLQDKIESLYVLARQGCTVERLRFVTGVTALFLIPKTKLVETTPERLMELDEALREGEVGYLVPKEEAILAERKLIEVREVRNK